MNEYENAVSPAVFEGIGQLSETFSYSYEIRELCGELIRLSYAFKYFLNFQL